MQYLRDWALAACFACVGCGVLLLFLPKSSLHNLVKAAVHIFFLVCILIPIVKLSPEDFTIDWQTAEETQQYEQALSETTRQQVQQNLTANLQPQIVDYLRQLGVKDENIYLNVNTDWEESISISSVDVILDAQYQTVKERLADALQRRFQLVFTVSCVGEDDQNG